MSDGHRDTPAAEHTCGQGASAAAAEHRSFAGYASGGEGQATKQGALMSSITHPRPQQLSIRFRIWLAVAFAVACTTVALILAATNDDGTSNPSPAASSQ